uniref:Armadillo repeat-containing protein 8 n=1 Tax=Steinernema glaseri TaxID=37863 RepID=A0A1I7Z637_9BILA
MNSHATEHPYGLGNPYPQCMPSTSAFPRFPQNNFQNGANQPSYYNFSKQHPTSNYLQPPSQNFAPPRFSSPGPMQQFQHNYLNRQQNTQHWVQQQFHGGFCSPGPGSSYASPAHSVVSHVSRYSTASQLTVVTSISPVAFCGAGSGPGTENIDPQFEQKALPHAVAQLHANLRLKSLSIEQVVRCLQTITQSASRYSVPEQKRSRLADFLDRGSIQRLFEFILVTSGEILPMDPTMALNDPFQILRRVWKLMFFLARCDVCSETLLQMKAVKQLVTCVLHAVRVGLNHSAYAILVFRKLLESRHGTEFRQVARAAPSVERLLGYLPYCHKTETPKQSSLASGNKYDVLNCLRLLLSGEIGSRRENDGTTVVRQKFVEMGGVEAMLQVLREDVEEPVLTSASGTLKAIVKTKGSERVAERMVSLGAIQVLAARLDHGSPILVQNCLMCMANICDQKAALESQAIETAIPQAVAVLGTTDIRIDQYATGFLVNVSTVPRLKEFVVRSGAVRALLQLVSMHAYTLFSTQRPEMAPTTAKPYVDVLDNSIRIIAYLSHGVNDAAVVRQLLVELSSFDDSLNLLKNLLKAAPPPDSQLRRSARKFRFIAENHLQLRRHVLLIVLRNMNQFGGANPFAEKLRAFSDAYVFPHTAFLLLFEVSDALRKIKANGSFSSRSVNDELQEITRLQAITIPNLVKEFAKLPEFGNYVAAYVKNEFFVNFFTSIRLHDNEQTEIQLVDFCTELLRLPTIRGNDTEAIRRLGLEQNPGRNERIAFAYDRLRLALGGDSDGFSDDSMGS